MESIKRSRIEDASLTVLTVTGVVTCEDIIHAFEDFIKTDVTPNLLWDFTDADLSRITQNDMRKILQIAKSNARLRKQGRTAIVGLQDVTYGLSRMYGILSDVNDHPIQHRVFRNTNDAMVWLKTDK